MLLANPIYDVVFKYLMEDKESAKLLLGEILQEEIVQLDLLPRESAFQIAPEAFKNLPASIQDEIKKGGQLNVYLQRMDFAANIKTKEGTLKKVLIEIQKAKYLAQIQRFRRYLGNAYLQRDADGHHRPIIAIYFLGETLPSVPMAVLGVEKKFVNKTTNKETALLKEVEFIELLMHEGIIVQIPRLGSQHQSALEEFLSIFDQKKALQGNPHFLEFDPEAYPEKYRAILRRLEHAACESDMQENMAWEDETQEVFATQEKKLEEYKKELEAEKEVSEQKDQVLAQKDQVLAQKDQVLAQKDQVLAQKEQVLAQKDQAIIDCVLALNELGVSAGKIMEKTQLSHDNIQAIIKQEKKQQ